MTAWLAKTHPVGYDYYEFGDEGGNLMKRDDGALYRLDRNTGTWVLGGYMISYLYGGDSEAISEEEAKALAASRQALSRPRRAV